MSGAKYSTYSYKDYLEDQERTKAKREMRLLKKKIRNFYSEVETSVKNIPRELHKKLADKVNKLNEWMDYYNDNIERKKVFSLLFEIAFDDSSKIKKKIQNLEVFFQVGKNDLLSLLTTKSSVEKEVKVLKEVSKKCISEIEKQKIEIISAKHLIDKWMSPDVCQSLLDMLDSASSEIDNENISEAQDLINQVKKQFEQINTEIISLEELFVKRTYAVESLQKACQRLAFGEQFKPHLEDENDYRSAIIYQVDTYNQGLINFRITLHGIETNSGIEKKICDTEYSQLSKVLLGEFGIETSFKHIDSDEDDPELIQKGELDFPDDASISVEGSY